MNKVDIKTERLYIRKFNENHLTNRYVAWLNDKEVVRYSEQRHKHHTIESCFSYWKSFKNTPNYLWAIEEIKAGLGHIGNINAYIDTNNSIADIGVLIGEKLAWKKGYGYESFKAVTNFLLYKKNIRKITAGTLTKNKPMIRIMEKMNMSQDGIRKKHYICENEECDLIHMAIFYKEN